MSDDKTLKRWKSFKSAFYTNIEIWIAFSQKVLYLSLFLLESMNRLFSFFLIIARIKGLKMCYNYEMITILLYFSILLPSALYNFIDLIQFFSSQEQRDNLPKDPGKMPRDHFNSEIFLRVRSRELAAKESRKILHKRSVP